LNFLGSDLDEEGEDRGYQFLQCVLVFIARSLQTGIDPSPLLPLLVEIFTLRAQPFYTFGTGTEYCEEIITGNETDSGLEAFEDSEKVSRMVFAEVRARNYNGSTRVTHVEGRFISNINSFGRSFGFKSMKDAILHQTPPFRVAHLRNLVAPIHEIKGFLTTEFLDWFSLDVFPRISHQVPSLYNHGGLTCGHR